MDCPQHDLDTQGNFFERIRLNRRRMPVHGSIELTFRCNLRCVHCYVGDQRGGPPRRPELSAAELRGLFDQMVDAGTLWLLLTGGDPLARPDFREIYSDAKHRGFLITLFTNGTLLTPATADFLADLPPLNTEITLYGATQATYERVTGIKGSYARCMRGIELLMQRGIPLKLKAMAMRWTAAEIPAMQAFARSLGVPFRYDPILRNDFDCRRAPFSHRLSAQEVVQLEMLDPDRVQEWREFHQQQSAVVMDERYHYSCGAGISMYHIDPFGRMTVCMSARGKSYDLRQGTFKDGWENFLHGVRFAPAPAKNDCSTCKIHALCGLCPAWTDLEQVEPGKRFDYLCQIAHRRAQAFGIHP